MRVRRSLDGWLNEIALCLGVKPARIKDRDLVRMWLVLMSRDAWREGAHYVDEEYGSTAPERWDDSCPYNADGTVDDHDPCD